MLGVVVELTSHDLIPISLLVEISEDERGLGTSNNDRRAMLAS